MSILKGIRDKFRKSDDSTISKYSCEYDDDNGRYNIVNDDTSNIVAYLIYENHEVLLITDKKLSVDDLDACLQFIHVIGGTV